MDVKPKSRFNTLGLKVFVLMTLLILSSIPRSFVDSLIRERQVNEQAAVASLVTGWAARHEIGNIKLEIPIEFSWFDEKEKQTIKNQDVIVVRPNQIQVELNDQIEQRRRGIYKIPVYKADLKIAGNFEVPKDLDPTRNNETLTLDTQRLFFRLPGSAAVSDFSLLVDGRPIALKRVDEGLLAKLGEKHFQPGQAVKFQLSARLIGYSGFDVRMIAEELEVKVSSRWPHPSFVGQLPVDQNIQAKGFSARWKLIQPNKGQVVSVNYVEPINVYSLSNRALKYGFLMTLLCLSTLFLVELLSGLAIHGMQYLLMTLPLTSFYLLLLAFAEQVGFMPAYGIASISVIGLTVTYFSMIGASRTQTASLGATLTAIYGLTLGMLSSEDYALLIGAVIIFLCLAAFMVLTAKIDWSKNLSAKRDSDEPTQNTFG